MPSALQHAGAPGDTALLAVLVAHLVATSLYAGFQLTVRVVVYPQMAAVDPAGFAAYEAGHQRRVTALVGPLFAAVAVTTAGLLVVGAPRAGAVASALLFAVVLAVTAVGAVPQHGALSRGFDADAHRRLLRWDGVRVAAALAQVAVATWMVVG